MDFVDALVRAKDALHLTDAQIARDAGVSRAWINALIHREARVAKKTKLAVTHAMCERIDNQLVAYMTKASLLERVRNELKEASKED